MARGPKLTKQQQRQVDRRRRVGQTPVGDDLLTGVVVTHHGHDLLIEDDVHKLHRARARRTVGRLATGDRIRWRHDDHGHVVVEQREERVNLLVRPDAYGKKKLMAANIDQVIIVTAPLPWMNPEVVERTLVAVLALPARPLILLNKADLLDKTAPADLEEIETTLALWQGLGFPVIWTSVKTGRGMDELETALAGRTSLMIGLSGVGKTSLTREITPLAGDAAIGEISAFNREGTHTTRASTLYRFADMPGGLIDAPGLRDFPLEQVPEEVLDAGFPEIAEAAAYCRFNDCRHMNEPGCAVLAAVDEGKILARRLRQYQELLKTD
ncbi:ribosome small subunit-dependent GTPase A [Guyparkeria sp.]|uniref:ribosome small subunit-dependent GTPase A n=1 Tax=Guyparkeria sp. TaxID=2035736 RepID=UPI0035633A62